MGDPRETRPFAPPDHSDPAARDTLRVTPPLRVGDRVAWVRRGEGFNGRDLEHLGTVAEAPDARGFVYVDLDKPRVDDSDPDGATRYYLPATDLYPRPGR